MLIGPLYSGLPPISGISQSDFSYNLLPPLPCRNPQLKAMFPAHLLNLQYISPSIHHTSPCYFAKTSIFIRLVPILNGEVTVAFTQSIMNAIFVYLRRRARLSPAKLQLNFTSGGSTSLLYLLSQT